MANLFEASSILYYLILPLIVGMGIDTRYRHRYAVAMSVGLVFYMFCCLWAMSGQASSLSEVEPIIILIVLGVSILMIGIIFEWKSESSVFQRNTLVFLTISVAGLPLYMIKYIVEGKAPIGYPESLLPLMQFTLALIALVVVANVFETRIYARKEGRIEYQQRLEEDDIDLDYEAMDEQDVEEILSGAKMTEAELRASELEDLDFEHYLDEL